MDGYFNEEQQQRLAQAKIGIAGAGGLGSNCAMHLVRSGIRQLVLADFDVVEPGNLNRQFYFSDQVGLPKIDALSENLHAIRPDLELDFFYDRITAENVAAVFADCLIVVEAFDHAADKQMLIETLAGSGKIVIAASGMAGWGNSDAIRIHRLNESLYLVGDLESAVSAELPPCSPRVGIVAAKEADVVLSLLLGKTP